MSERERLIELLQEWGNKENEEHPDYEIEEF